MNSTSTFAPATSTVPAPTITPVRAESEQLAMLPDVVDEGIQIACVLLPILSLLSNLVLRCYHMLVPSSRKSMQRLLNADASRSDAEGGTLGAARSMAQRDADRDEEAAIKQRASERAMTALR